MIYYYCRPVVPRSIVPVGQVTVVGPVENVSEPDRRPVPHQTRRSGRAVKRDGPWVERHEVVLEDVHGVELNPVNQPTFALGPDRLPGRPSDQHQRPVQRVRQSDLKKYLSKSMVTYVFNFTQIAI